MTDTARERLLGEIATTPSRVAQEMALLALEAAAEILSRAYEQPFDPIKAIRALADEVRRARGRARAIGEVGRGQHPPN